MGHPGREMGRRREQAPLMEARQLKVETRRLRNDAAIIPANGKMLGHFEISIVSEISGTDNRFWESIGQHEWSITAPYQKWLFLRHDEIFEVA